MDLDNMWEVFLQAVSFWPPQKDYGMSLDDIVDDDIALQQLRSYFLASITHEFRTPLSALNASVEFLLDEIDHLSKEEIKDLLRSIHLSSTGLQTLIENLLESINIEAGRVTVRLRLIDLDDVVEEAGRVVRPLLNRRSQKLEVSCPPWLPQVKGDATRLQQALVNLLSNASKYGPMEQIIDLTIDHVAGEFVRVSVADRGPGISPTDREKLFHRFVRLDTPGTAQYGVGLGLSVVKAIIEEHGGKVGVDARPSGGSIFWFTIPVEDIEL
jgi:K+-sensing histidine kinase KdpD